MLPPRAYFQRKMGFRAAVTSSTRVVRVMCGAFSTVSGESSTSFAMEIMASMKRSSSSFDPFARPSSVHASRRPQRRRRAPALRYFRRIQLISGTLRTPQISKKHFALEIQIPLRPTLLAKPPAKCMVWFCRDASDSDGDDCGELIGSGANSVEEAGFQVLT